MYECVRTSTNNILYNNSSLCHAQVQAEGDAHTAGRGYCERTPKEADDETLHVSGMHSRMHVSRSQLVIH